MADRVSREQRSAMMSAVRNKNSKIEQEVERALRRNSLRFSKHSPTLPGKPDFFSKKAKTVIFVDSCFWHGCRYHGSIPLSNTEFWAKKIARNKSRDREVNRAYKSMGWRVLRVWEHYIRNSDTNKLDSLLKQLR